MNNKQRMHAALEGKPVDRNPVTVLYNMLYHEDHFSELTSLPQWQVAGWTEAAVEEYMQLYRRMVEQAPFECLQPHTAPPRAVRSDTELIEMGGQHFRHDRRDGSMTRVADPVSGHGKDYGANETRYVFDQHDVDERVKVTPAADVIASGINDYVEAAVRAFGADHFILSGGVIGTIYSCSSYVGLTNVFSLLVEQPDLMDYLCQKILEQNIEQIRALAAAGGDAIYIDDATATRDMISLKHYERFSLPYMRAMVDEIHRLGHKAIIIYFGGIADRLEQIASIGADGLSMETSMKSYTNDIDAICRQIGGKVTIFGNIDPVGVLQDASDNDLEAEMRRQALAGRQARGFVMCTGSPITPATPLARVQRFIELGKSVK
jgi:uroporphyrinogen-III decarboxylase